MRMTFDLSYLPEALCLPIREVFPVLGFSEESTGIPLKAAPCDRLTVRYDGKEIKIGYSAKNEIFRALKIIKQQSLKSDFQVAETRFTDELGIMLDCSRNAVRNTEHLKKMIRMLALTGYNQLQLYTEDTYEIDGEPYFGYLRGRYSQAELKEIVGYADRFGIEVVPCIQTLAHLNQMFRWWGAYEKINDTGDIMLIDEEETYRLIEKMIASCRACYQTDKIHIGMDEAHLVGRGTYEDKFGAAKNRFELLSKHLKRVIAICEKYDFKPMMWADMFFRLAFHGGYYPEIGSDFPQDIYDKVPQNVRLVYWDYYHTEYEPYDYLLKMHRKLSDDVSFAGGAWRWHGFAPNNGFSIACTENAMNACKANGVNNILITMWGDDGAEGSDFGVLPALVMAAEKAYGHDDYKDAFQALTNVRAEEYIKLDFANVIEEKSKQENDNCNKTRLYNDPFSGSFDSLIKKGENEIFAQHAKDLADAEKQAGEYRYLFTTQRLLCEVLSLKSELGILTREAYRKRDKEKLKELIRKNYIPLLGKLNEFYDAYRAQWYQENKPYGIEIQDYRIGGVKQRIATCIETLESYINGTINCIPQLEEDILEFKGGSAKWMFTGMIGGNLL